VAKKTAKSSESKQHIIKFSVTAEELRRIRLGAIRNDCRSAGAYAKKLTLAATEKEK
jgi:hypothetical protein